MDSSDDEFFDAEDNLDSIIEFPNPSDGYKLLNKLHIQEIMSPEGMQFEIEIPKARAVPGGRPSEINNPKGIFSKPYLLPAKAQEPKNEESRESLKDADIDLYYDEVEKTMESILPCGGIKKLVIQHGLGNLPNIGQIVLIYYVIYLEGVPEPIDSTMWRQKSVRFQIGSGSVISVLDQGTRTMAMGETAKFLARPEFAYGALGSPPRIPPESRAMVTIKLLKIQDEWRLSIREMDRKQRSALSFDVLCNAAIEFKEEGNRYFRKEKLSKAVRRYNVALSILRDISTTEKELEIKRQELFCMMFNNLGQSYILLGKYDDAIKSCKAAIDLPLPSVKKRKSYFRYAKALLSKGRAQEAKDVMDSADELHALDLFDAEVHQLHTEIITQMEMDKVSTKNLAEKMFMK